MQKGNVFTSMCQEFCPQEGVYSSKNWDRHPPEQTPPWKDTPPPGRHPSRQTSRWTDTPEANTPQPLRRMVCILPECVLVNARKFMYVVLLVQRIFDSINSQSTTFTSLAACVEWILIFGLLLFALIPLLHYFLQAHFPRVVVRLDDWSGSKPPSGTFPWTASDLTLLHF